MRTTKGQATIEMVFILPLLLMLAAGMLFMAYAGWQDLKVQQAANLAARVVGQEKVVGGTSTEEIDQENGFTSGADHMKVDPTGFVNNSLLDIAPDTQATTGGGSLFTRVTALVKGLYAPGEKNRVFVATPRSGINVDQVNVFRVLNVPQIPFFKGNGSLPKSIVLRGTAYGGEDPSMYALPRWGIANDSHGKPDWRNMLKSAKDPNHHLPD